MKQILVAGLAGLLLAGTACKTKGRDNAAGTTSTQTTQTTPTTPNMEVQVNNDDALRQGVTDATKDVKGLTTRVENGIIYLSGTISRDDNMRINPTLSSLRPKSIDRSGLTVQP